MKRFIGMLIFCLFSVLIYAQESFNFSSKYKTDSLEKETKYYYSVNLFQNQPKPATSSELKMRISYGASSKYLNESDSLNLTPKKEEVISDQEREK